MKAIRKQKREQMLQTRRMKVSSTAYHQEEAGKIEAVSKVSSPEEDKKVMKTVCLQIRSDQLRDDITRFREVECLNKLLLKNEEKDGYQTLIIEILEMGIGARLMHTMRSTCSVELK